MLIQGKYGEYNVYYSKYGYTYATAVIYQDDKSFWGSLFKKKKKVWKDSCFTKDWKEAECMYKGPMVEWFKEAVERYEEYLDSWRE